MADIEELASQLSELTIMEMTELTKKLEEKWDVSASAGAPMVVQGEGEGDESEEESEEKAAYDVILKEVGDKKINVIKAVRKVTDLGLKEAKELVDNTPNPVKETVPTEDAEEMKEMFEEEGATVELK